MVPKSSSSNDMNNQRNSERRRDLRSRSPGKNQQVSYRSRSPLRNHRGAMTRSSRPKTESRLLNLPKELRDMIVEHLFDSTRLTFGHRKISSEYRKVLPARNALAILRVCKQMYQETSNIWISRVLFDFEDTFPLLDKFSLLPISTISQIRNVRIRMKGEEPEAPETVEGEEQLYGLQVLQGLQLDRLTVIPVWGDSYTGCADIARFIATSFPCKELCYHTPKSCFHENNESTSADVTDFLTRRINTMADQILDRDRYGTPLTIQILQSSEPSSQRTGAVFKDSVIQVLEETSISKDIDPAKMVACGKALDTNAETLIIFKPAATSSTLPDEALQGIFKTVDDIQVRKTWRDDYRDHYVREAEENKPDMGNITTGELYPWPFEMRKTHTIIDRYENVNDVIWPGRNVEQAWPGANTI
ncbi:uncharacterized protein Bfra_000020 [Botrytis fragariae]|uniref:F-box domain-containing protein n=1 Tax=Botrytis fragariae TaxID=1964551 RepID=A0A8H6B2A5_9HELO|nr:uncharacterized protein Bfra_000020 [Botrytis fragariae]KAF5877858.1 hypothetical protein Bfra_000020 [Botrytis fragariae]